MIKNIFKIISVVFGLIVVVELYFIIYSSNLFRSIPIIIGTIIIGIIIYFYTPLNTILKIILIISTVIIVGIIVYFYFPMMKNPMPDYSFGSPQHYSNSKPVYFQKWVTLREYSKRIGLEY